VVLCLIFLLCAAFADVVPLDRRSDLIRNIELPTDKTFQDVDYIPISGPWKLVSSLNGTRTWESPLPIRSRSLFFFKPPSGMDVFQRKNKKDTWSEENKLEFSKRTSTKDDSWNYSSHSLRVNRKIEDGPPESWRYSMKYQKASEREKVLSDYNTKDPKSYIVRSQQIEDQTRHGLYLPAPTTVEYVLVIPENAIFEGNLTIIPPEAADPSLESDGVDLIIEVDDGTTIHNIDTISGEIGIYRPFRLSLKQFSGQKITLRLRSNPRGSTSFDYLFVADPIIRVPKEKPKKVIWIFIDTLRQDHLSLYGYDRPTTPKLDAWAKNAAVYTQARSIAPWTLPSARSMITGNVPEKWGIVPTLQQQFSQQGWNTIFLAGNIYLSSNFEMSKDWTIHRCVNWPLAEFQLARAKNILKQNDDRDVFLMLHLMDMHLPYTEPLSYRYTFSGKRPSFLSSDDFGRTEIIKGIKKAEKQGRQYIIDRYDNNLRYIDDVLSEFLKTLPEDSVVMIFSDHGEEFWDHGGFEHGHTLYDELLKIPMIVKSPNLQPGVYDYPVSVLDLLPTSAALADIPIAATAGWSLNSHTADEFRQRPQAFGRVLYGDDGWSSLQNEHKYISRKGNEHVFNIHADPKEKVKIQDQESIQQGRTSLQNALNREVKQGIRIILKRSRTQKDATVIIQFPTGIQAAWRGSNPTKNAGMEIEYTEDTAVFTWNGGSSGSREAFIVPQGNTLEALNSIEAYLMIDGKKEPFKTMQFEIPPYNSKEKKIMRSAIDGRTSYITYMMMPIPAEDDQTLNAFDDEVSEELKILGYVE
jgi:arylsulfatase A-like enzyme